jgi:hypothetical protein
MSIINSEKAAPFKPHMGNMNLAKTKEKTLIIRYKKATR